MYHFYMFLIHVNCYKNIARRHRNKPKVEKIKKKSAKIITSEI